MSVNLLLQITYEIYYIIQIIAMYVHCIMQHTFHLSKNTLLYVSWSSNFPITRIRSGKMFHLCMSALNLSKVTHRDRHPILIFTGSYNYIIIYFISGIKYINIVR